MYQYLYITCTTINKFADVVISPPTITVFVVVNTSQATRDSGSMANAASNTASEIWSAILSGCPSDTDSDVNNTFSNF